MARNTLKDSEQKYEYGMRVADSIEECSVTLTKALDKILEACNVIRVNRVAESTYDPFVAVQHVFVELGKEITGALASDAKALAKFDEEHNIGEELGDKMRKLASRLESVELKKAPERTTKYSGTDENWEQNEKEEIVRSIKNFLAARYDFITNLGMLTKKYATDEIRDTYMGYGKKFEKSTNAMVHEAAAAIKDITEFGDALNNLFKKMEENAQSVRTVSYEPKPRKRA